MLQKVKKFQRRQTILIFEFTGHNATWYTTILKPCTLQ